MPTLKRTINTTASPQAAFDYLLDFENAEEWDSGTVSCKRVSGDGGQGTVYRNVSKFAGRTIELDYTVESVGENQFNIVGRTPTTTSDDLIVVEGHGAGARVTYTADFTFSGPARFLGPLMRPLLKRLGDETEKQLKHALDRLATGQPPASTE